MRPLFVFSLLILAQACTPVLAKDLGFLAQRAKALLEDGFSPDARLLQEKPFAFYEDCQRMPTQVLAKDPVTQKLRRLAVDIYRTRRSPRVRSVLIIPPTDGANFLDRGFAEQLCQKGLESWLLREWDAGKNRLEVSLDLESQDQSARRAVSAIRQIVGLMPGRVGILGTSEGALIASVALAVEAKLVGGVLVTPGADLAEILTRSANEKVRRLRAARQRAFGWTLAEYGFQLRERVMIDPLYLAPRLRAKKVGIVIAAQDDVIPVRNQFLFESISGSRRLAVVNNGHTTGILINALLNAPRVWDFLLRL